MKATMVLERAVLVISYVHIVILLRVQPHPHSNSCAGGNGGDGDIGDSGDDAGESALGDKFCA